MKKNVAMMLFLLVCLNYFNPLDCMGQTNQQGQTFQGLSKLIVSPDGTKFLAAYDKNQAPVFLQRKNDEEQWNQIRDLPSLDYLGVSAAAFPDGRVLMAFVIGRYKSSKHLILYKIWNGSTWEPEVTIEIPFEPAVGFTVIVNEDLKYCFLLGESREYSLGLWSSIVTLGDTDSKAKINALQYDPEMKTSKITRLTPASGNLKYLNGWAPIITQSKNSVNFYCKELNWREDGKRHPDSDIVLVKYCFDAKGKVQRKELFKGVTSFDAAELDKDKTLLIIGSVEGGVDKYGEVEGGTIKLVILQEDNLFMNEMLGKGTHPKIVRDEHGGFNIFWMRKEKTATQLIQTLYKNGRISNEEIIVDDMGESTDYYFNGYPGFSHKDLYTAAMNPDGSIIIVWENKGKLMEKTVK